MSHAPEQHCAWQSSTAILFTSSCALRNSAVNGPGAHLARLLDLSQQDGLVPLRLDVLLVQADHLRSGLSFLATARQMLLQTALGGCQAQDYADALCKVNRAHCWAAHVHCAQRAGLTRQGGDTSSMTVSVANLLFHTHLGEAVDGLPQHGRVLLSRQGSQVAPLASILHSRGGRFRCAPPSNTSSCSHRSGSCTSLV